MPYSTGTKLSGLVPRLLMVAVCFVPVSGPRAIATAFHLAPPPVAPGQVPTSPVNEEEETHRTENTGDRPSETRLERRADRSRSGSSRESVLLCAFRPITRSRTDHLRPTDADPFHNGLGTPIRC